MTSLEVIALEGLPFVRPGDDLVELIASALTRNDVAPRAGDVLVVAQKIVSKAEGRMVDLATVEPSAKALTLAAEVDKDPRLVELILSESVRVVRARRNVLIVEHRLGFIMANAGVDQSNVAPADGASRALLLPENPDRSAETLRRGLAAATGIDLAVVINDSFGRAWRQGTAGVAIGVAGLPALIDLRGRPDLFGRTLEASVIGFADEIAAAASLVMGQADEATPVVLIRGLRWSAPESTAASIIRLRKRGSVSMSRDLVVALSGGIGGAKLALGLSRIVKPEDLIVVANVGDDFEHLGLHISPDADTLDVHARRPRQCEARLGPAGRNLVVHGDADGARRRGLVPPRRSRPGGSYGAHASAAAGRESLRHHRPTFAAASASVPACFRRRTIDCARDCGRTRDGSTSRIISCACNAGPSCASLPSTARTHARPHADLLAALSDERLRAVIICPSNPFISVEPILAVPGIRAGSFRLRCARHRGFSDHRRTRGQGSDRQNDDGAWNDSERRRGRSSATAICSMAM